MGEIINALVMKSIGEVAATAEFTSDGRPTPGGTSVTRFVGRTLLRGR